MKIRAMFTSSLNTQIIAHRIANSFAEKCQRQFILLPNSRKNANFFVIPS